jgi:RHS repeat-associated protein
MLSTLTSANRHPLLREFIWFVIFTFMLSCMPHLELFFPYRVRFFSEAEAQTLEDTLPDLVDKIPPPTDKAVEAPESVTPEGGSAMTSGGSSSEYQEQITPSFSFKVDDFSGAAHLTYPIVVPPARGPAPQVSVAYSSSGGNTWISVGWDLGMGFIQRRGPRKGVPTYDDSKDTFELQTPGGSPQDLVKVVGGTYNGEYRLKIEGSLLRIKYFSQGNKWEVTDKDGLVMRFGQSDVSRVLRTAPYGSGTYRWCMDEVEDLRTNYLQVSYQKPAHSPGQIYLDEINYNGNKTSGFAHNQRVKFILEGTDRPDPIYNYRGGFKSLTKRRLGSIEIKTRTGVQQWTNVRKYVLAYPGTAPNARSVLSSITLYGDDYQTSLPATTFTYQTHTLGFNSSPITWYNPSTWSDTGGNYLRGTNTYGIYSGLYDINGDGLVERVVYDRLTQENQTWKVFQNLGDRFQGTTIEDGDDWPNPSAWGGVNGNYIRDPTGSKYDILDMDGDGLIDRVVYDRDSPYDTWEFYRNTGSGFDTLDGWSNPSAWGPTGGNYIRNVNEGGTYTEVIDLNGDSLPDRIVYDKTSPYNAWTVYFNKGDGTGFDAGVDWTNPSAQDSVIGNYMRNSNGGKYDLIDINGDGLTDHVFWDQSSPYDTWVVFFNYGSGFDQGINWPNPSAWGSIDGNYLRDTGANKYDLIDLNGDGLPDRVVYDRWDAQDRPWKVYFNNGAGFNAGVDWPNPSAWGSGDTYGNFIRDTDGNKFDVIDMNGDGLPDRVVYDKDYDYDSQDPQPAQWKVYLNNGPAADLLASAQNGIGGTMEISYTPSTAYRNEAGELLNQIPFAVQTVSSYTQKDGRQTGGVDNAYTYQYTYSGGYYDPGTVEFRGFHVVTAYQMRNETEYESKTETTFLQGEYDKGRAEIQVTTSHEGHIKQVENTWVLADTLGGGKFAYLDTVTTTVTDLETDPYTQETRDFYDIVREGSNVTLETQTLNLLEEHKNEGSSEEIVTCMEYTNDWNKWILSKITMATVKDPNNGNAIASRKWMDYNGDGNLTTEEVCKSDDPNDQDTGCLSRNSTQNVVTSYGYDATWKVLNQVTDPRGYLTTVTYDSTKTFVYETTKCADLQCTNQHKTATVYDQGTGNLLKFVPPHLQNTDYWLQTRYDTFGRKTLERMKDNSDPNTSPIVDRGDTSYAYNSYGNPNTQHVLKTGRIVVEGVPSRTLALHGYTYFDGMGRTYMAKTDGPDDKTIHIETLFDSVGRVWKRSNPYFCAAQGCDSSYFTIMAYDGLSRVTTVEKPDKPADRPDGPGYRISTTYQGSTKTVSKEYADDLWRTMSYTYDRNQKLVKVGEGIGVSGQVTYTEYRYNVLGNPVQVHAAMDASENDIYPEPDPTPIITTMTYDSLSKKRTMSDPDMGEWSYEYDKFGNLITQTDARDKVITFTYDGLNRLTQKVYENATPLEKVVYTYDDQQVSNSKGNLTRISHLVGDPEVEVDAELVLEYDLMHRVKKVQKNIGAETATFEKAYDSAGRVISIKYLAGTLSEKVYDYEYDVPGNLLYVKESGAADSVVDYSDFTALGQPQFAIFPKSATVSVKTSYGYYPETGRLHTLATQKIVNGQVNTTYQNLDYQEYDGVGNIIVLDDVQNDITHNYTYDHLNRLTYAEGVGDNSYTRSFTYDRIGNILTKSDVGTYSYDYLGKPHAVNYTRDGSIDIDLEYDANGNMTQRASGGVTLDLSYNYENKPYRIQRGQQDHVLFSYDGNGQRIRKENVSIDATVLYFGELYELRQTANVIHLFAGTRRIASMRSDGNDQFYHPNHLDSASVITDTNGGIKQRIEYYPFGTYRYSANPQDQRATYDFDLDFPNVNYTFTDQEDDDDLGLYNYGARLYDPVLGRFISPDGIVQAPDNPQTLNRYSYAVNNPLVYTDPSGNIFIIDDIIAVMVIIAEAILASELATAIVGGAILGAAMSAATGGNILQGAITGAISGALFFGAGELLAVLKEGIQLTMLQQVALTSVVHSAAGAISGGINAAITGSKIGLGVLTGAVAAGIASPVGNALPDKFGYQLVGRMIAGGLSGGIVAEIYGGNFWEGAARGATTAAAAFLFNESLKHGKERLDKLVNGMKRVVNAVPEKVAENVGFLVELGGIVLKGAWGAGCTFISATWNIMSVTVKGAEQIQNSDSFGKAREAIGD